MAEPITIGGQTFVKTTDGWVDQKTKSKAPEGLLPLLNRLQVENSPEGKKKRVRIDTSRPVVKLGKTEYVWDLNSGVWIDKKTKDAANPAFSKLIEAAYQGIVQGTTEEEKLYESWAKKAAAGQVFAGMGATGQAGKQKIKKSSGSGRLPAPNIKINSPIIRMIEKLSVIDGYLKQRLANDIALSNSQSVSAKEQAIEQSAIQTDATPNLEENVDAEVEKTNKESQAILVAGAVAAGALFISQLDPVKETFNSIIGFAKGVYNFASGIVSTINEGLVRIVGTPESREEQSSSNPGATPTANTERSASTVQSASDGAEDNAAFPGPGESSASNGRASGGAASPEEITTPFPGPTSSSNTQRNTTSSSAEAAAPAPSATDATRVRSPSAAPTTPASSPSATPSPPAAAPTPAATPVQDDRNWWQRNMPSFLGGREAPTSSATPADRRKVRGGSNSGAQDTVNGYISPVEGHSINSPYGMRTHPVLKTRKFHTGVDIAAPGGTPVRAVKSGTVTKLSSNQSPYSGFGNVVIIDHGDGYQTVYAHLSRFACRVGETVRQGQIIGYVGSTGMSTGNHLHFIVQKTGFAAPSQGNTVNPAPLLRQGGMTIPASMEGYDMEGGGDGSMLEQVASSAGDLTKGAMEAIGTILRAGLGSDTMTPTSGSQLSTVNDTMSGNIARAARERTATVAATKTPEPVATTRSDPVNMNSSTGSSTIQNMPTTSDKAGVEFYLTRMGFPKIIYTQTARGATLR